MKKKLKIEGYNGGENGKIIIRSENKKTLDDVFDMSKVEVDNCKVTNAPPHHQHGRVVEIKGCHIQTDKSKPLLKAETIITAPIEEECEDPLLTTDGKTLMEEVLTPGYYPSIEMCLINMWRSKYV